MVTVQGVVDRVGSTLLRSIEPAPVSQRVTDVVIAEDPKRQSIAAGDLVLGVAVGTARDAVTLVRHAGERNAAAVLLKPPLATQSLVRAAARRSGTSVVEVHPQTAWAQLVWLLRTVLDAAAEESESDAASSNDAGALGDLFRLADAVAAVVDAPVTIEDVGSRVLAYSARQDLTDPARVATVLGRRIPDDVLAKFRSKGVFRELSMGRRAIFVPAQVDGTLPRLIVPIRMGGELLGSMWAVVDGEVSDERAAAFADVGPVVALHLLRRRARTDAKRRRVGGVLRALLEGSTSPRVAAAELDLADGAYRVVAVDVPGEPDDAEGARLALTERITAGFSRRPVTELHGVLYTLVPDDADGWPSLCASLARAAHPAGPLVAAGEPGELAELGRSMAQADETLGLLRAGLLPTTTASYGQVWVTLTLHRAASAANAAGVVELGPLATLRELDTSA
ncbi:MAG: PucR family transcriptional regulator, partial [Sciscionella sp.]